MWERKCNINDMRKRNQILLVALIISTGLISSNVPTSWAADPSTKPQRMMTFVGGDIHTLTFTKDGLFVTGHEGGSLSTNEGVKWKSVASFKNTDIMGWATMDSGYLAGGHNGLFRSSDGGKSFTGVSFYRKASDVHSLGASAKNVYMGSPQVDFFALPIVASRGKLRIRNLEKDAWAQYWLILPIRCL